MSTLQQSILNTLCYSSLFQYPLTIDQLYTYLISKRKVSKTQLQETLPTISLVKKVGNYYTLRNKKSLVTIRKRREKESLYKMKKALYIAKVLSLLPYVQFIGLSGSLAMRNSEKDDDIDMLIITQPYTLWISRFFVVCILSILGFKRKPKSIRAADAICTNMFLTRNNLALSKSMRNLYTAHEVVQVKCLINKNNTFELFLSKNQWVHEYLPNVSIEKVPAKKTPTNLLLSGIDYLFFKIQYFYMKSKITHEIITQQSAFFHPQGMRNDILARYEKEIKNRENHEDNRKKSQSTNPIVQPQKTAFLASVFTPGS